MIEDYRKRKGWVSNSLLDGNKSVILITQKGNLYSGPNPDEDIVADMNYGIIMQVEEVQGEWLKVMNADGVEGWLPQKSVWPGEKQVRSEE